MSQSSLFWDGTVTGDATEAPYEAATVFSEVLMDMMGHTNLTNKGGVVASYLNQLNPTAALQTVTVDTGKAWSYGGRYINDASVPFVLPTPVSLTRIDRIVVAKIWNAQTVRLVRIAGTEGGAEPSLIQAVGTEWDIPICKASITTGGIITLTDEREILADPGGAKTGDIQFSFRNTAPAGWVEFYGQTVDARNSPYISLYNWANNEGHIGAGQLFTGTQAALVFADLRSTVIIPQDKDPNGNARGLIAALANIGAATGEAAHLLSAVESGIPVHLHNNVLTDNHHVHSVSTGGSGAGILLGGTTNVHLNDLTTTVPDVTPMSLENIDAGPTAAASAHNNVQPSIAANVFVKL